MNPAKNGGITLAPHIQLESKISITLRQGYVGRNLATGDLSTNLQNGYERIMQGDLQAFRFDHVENAGDIACRLLPAQPVL